MAKVPLPLASGDKILASWHNELRELVLSEMRSTGFSSRAPERVQRAQIRNDSGYAIPRFSAVRLDGLRGDNLVYSGERPDRAGLLRVGFSWNAIPSQRRGEVLLEQGIVRCSGDRELGACCGTKKNSFTFQIFDGGPWVVHAILDDVGWLSSYDNLVFVERTR